MERPAGVPVCFRSQECQQQAASNLRVPGGNITCTAPTPAKRNFKTFVQGWKKKYLLQIPRITYLKWINQVADRLKAASFSAAGASQPCLCAHMCTVGGHMCAQVCPSARYGHQCFFKAILITFTIFSSWKKKGPLGKLHINEIIFLRNIYTQLKKKPLLFLTWHKGRIYYNLSK